MKIFSGVVSGPKATPSTLYNTYMGGFSYIARSSDGSPITFNKSVFKRSQSDLQTVFPPEEEDLEISMSSLPGNLNLLIATCFHPNNGAGQIFFDQVVGDWFYPNSDGLTSAPDKRFSVVYNTNITPSSTISGGISLHNASEGHDHLYCILNYHCTSTVNAHAGNDQKQNIGGDSTSVVIPISPNQQVGDLVVVCVVHRFPIKAEFGWNLDFSQAISGEQSNVTPYLRGQRISVYSQISPIGLLEDPRFEVIGS